MWRYVKAHERKKTHFSRWLLLGGRCYIAPQPSVDAKVPRCGLACCHPCTSISGSESAAAAARASYAHTVPLVSVCTRIGHHVMLCPVGGIDRRSDLHPGVQPVVPLGLQKHLQFGLNDSSSEAESGARHVFQTVPGSQRRSTACTTGPVVQVHRA
jgi:hypothetical protein